MHFLQHWYGLSDPTAEEALYDLALHRKFVGIDLSRQRVPNETTICKFRQLLEQHGLCKKIFEEINAYLAEQILRISTSRMVNATIIETLSLNKNKAHKRGLDMNSTRRSNQWYFGMKAHVDVGRACVRGNEMSLRHD